LLEGKHVKVQTVAKMRILPVFSYRRQHNAALSRDRGILIVSVISAASLRFDQCQFFRTQQALDLHLAFQCG
jgi:hypothetical protein